MLYIIPMARINQSIQHIRTALRSTYQRELYVNQVVQPQILCPPPLHYSSIKARVPSLGTHLYIMCFLSHITDGLRTYPHWPFCSNIAALR